MGLLDNSWEGKAFAKRWTRGRLHPGGDRMFRNRLAFIVLTAMPAAAAAQAEQAPQPIGLELAVRGGFGLPFGDLLDDTGGGIRDQISGSIPIWIDIGYRVAPAVVVGVYGQLGIGLTRNCPM